MAHYRKLYRNVYIFQGEERKSMCVFNSVQKLVAWRPYSSIGYEELWVNKHNTIIVKFTPFGKKEAICH